MLTSWEFWLGVAIGAIVFFLVVKPLLDKLFRR